MGLYDVIDEISRVSVTKTETGDVRIPGVLVGQVVSNYNKDMPGRVCVRIPVRGIDKQGDTIKWARVASFYMGKNWGEYFQPEVGDEVLLVFEQGNIEKPYVIGSIPNDNGGNKSKVLDKSFNEHNTIKTIQTSHGSHITFVDDNENDKGEQDIITVETAANMHKIEMNNNKKFIKLTDKQSDNYIEMDTEKGDIKVHSKKIIELVVDGQKKCVIKLNGESGQITISAEDILVEAKTKNVKIKGNAGVKINSQGQFIASAENLAKVEGKLGILSASTISLKKK